MAENKTKPSAKNVSAFLAAQKNQPYEDCMQLLELFSSVSGKSPTMWGSSIIGFGKYYYKNTAQKKAEWFLTGFSPRKQHFAIYIMTGLDAFKEDLKRIGPHKTGVSCIYFKQLDQIRLNVLKQIIMQSIKTLNQCTSCIRIENP